MTPTEFAERRTKMRSPKRGLSLLTLLSLSALPLVAEALEVRFCIPSCASDPNPAIRRSVGTGPAPIVDGVAKTTLSIPAFNHTGTISGRTVTFAISATVTSEQSGTLQKITFTPTTLTGDSGCRSTTPCRIEIIATSDHAANGGGAYVLDFPTEKPAGGYPAGVFMMGSFSATQGVNPNGDWISMTGESSGLSLSTGSSGAVSAATPVNTDVINAAPGTGPGNTGTSLPSSCTGKPSCRFVASSLRSGFSTNITETVQQACAGQAASCLTRLKTTLNVEIKNPGVQVTLPALYGVADSTEELVQGTIVPIGTVEFGSLLIGVNDFLVTAKLKLDPGKTIDPVTEEVLFGVGPSGTPSTGFSMSIPPKHFKRLLQGRLFTFVGTVNGRGVAATFARDRKDPTLWTFVAGVHGVDLTGVDGPPSQVPVNITVGSTFGSDLATAKFLVRPSP